LGITLPFEWFRAAGGSTRIPDRLRIEILGGQPVTSLQQTFCHEWTHAMLDMMAHPLSRDEQFVDQLGHLLQQSLTTFEE
jgi:hypothetical protein